MSNLSTTSQPGAPTTPNKLLIESLANQGIIISPQTGFISLPVWCKSVKIDVGLSFNAPMTTEWLRRQPLGLLVFSFEPITDNLERSRELVNKITQDSPGTSRAITLPFALGEIESSELMYVTSDRGESSLLEPLGKGPTRLETVTSIRLESLLCLFDWDDCERIDFLKTDCQGTDIAVLRGAGKFIEKIAVITCEADTPGYRGSKNSFTRIAKLLEPRGFMCSNPRPRYRRVIGRVLEFLPALKTLYMQLAKKPKNLSTHSNQTSIETEDPTFFNKRYISAINRGDVVAYQRG